MALTRKPDGAANFRFYDSSETMNCLEDVKSWLQKHQKKVSRRNIDRLMPYSFADCRQ